MTRTRSHLPVRIAALAALAAVLMLAGCGVKGDPELPPLKAGEDGKVPERGPEPKDDPNKPFILDFLL